MALLERKALRNSTAPWFGRYAARQVFRKLGYTSDFKEMDAQEADWFIAIDIAFGTAQRAIQKRKEMLK